MPAGGYRVGAGRHADPNALRRERKTDTIAWVHLPAIGRLEPAPDWPLTRPTKRELAIWAEEWRRPQAIMWDQLGLSREVAMYVRSLRIAENPRSRSTERALVAQYMNDLGISVRGMAGLRWTIDPPVAEGPPAPDAPADAVVLEKDRFLRVVESAG